jgi:predicted dithiol-disulfide oxidoreductase (DUF899 family)
MTDICFPGEASEYRAARDRLLEREVELRRLTEEVAEARRALPPGGPIPEDYVLSGLHADNTAGEVRFSELFGPDRDTLVIYSMMFPVEPDGEAPCPSCTSFLDALDGAAPHITQRVNLAIVVKAPLDPLLAHARDRGWRHLRLLSSAGTAFNRDYLAEIPADGGGVQQMPMTNVFRRDGDAIRHFWGSELLYAPAEPGQDPRHSDTIDPQWNVFDLCPEGRGTDWNPALSYADAPPRCCG